MANNVAQNLQRLQTARTNIKNSIENKGVIVPASTKLYDFPSFIDSIPTKSIIEEGTVISTNTSYQIQEPSAYKCGDLLAVNFVGRVFFSRDVTISDVFSAIEVSGFDLPTKYANNIWAGLFTYIDANGRCAYYMINYNPETKKFYAGEDGNTIHLPTDNNNYSSFSYIGDFS